MRKFDVEVKGEGFIIKVCNLVNGQPDGNWEYYPMIFDLLYREIKNHEEDKISYSEEYDSLYDMWKDGKYDSGVKFDGEEEFSWLDEESFNISICQNDGKDNWMFKNVRSCIERYMTSPFVIGYSKICYITCKYQIEIADNETLDVLDVPMLKINGEFAFLKNGIIPNQIMYKNTLIDSVLTIVEDHTKMFSSKLLYIYDREKSKQYNYDGYDEFFENFTTFNYTGQDSYDINLKDLRDQIEETLINEVIKNISKEQDE